ncbi:MAG: peptidase E [Dehalococcoidia bacterium]
MNVRARKIVAIGGGDIGALETLPIDREVVRLTGTARPRALFIPTASSDDAEGWRRAGFERAYGVELGCETDVLYLLGTSPSRRELEDRVLSSDLVYVGGGNTLKLMRRWRRLELDQVLEEAHRRGIVLSGLSAGAICWFSHGHSDSMSFYHPEDWNYIRVRGMGLVDALGVTHYHAEGREADFQRMVARGGQTGIAIDNNCALEFIDDTYRVITSRDEARAYRVFRRGGEVVTERIEQSEELRPVAELLGA